MKTDKSDSAKETTDLKSTPEREYNYRHAGIRVRHGLIPLWLILVAIGLTVWGIYYIIRFWNP